MSISKEDYLRTVYALDEKTDEKGIKAVDVAKELKVSKPSVSEMVKKLCDNGFLDAEPYSKIRLTKKGRKEAERVMHNHRVIEVFLKRILEYDIDKVHEEAHRLEHAFSQESIERLDRFLENPKVSPSGKEIPH
ncbi:MAG: metal-dependent transcriptional regulator [Nanoarchaeota archaeon]